MKMIRAVAAVWRPIRLVGTGLAFVAAFATTNSFQMALRLFGISLGLIFLARLLHAVRWPRLDRYLAIVGPVGPPRDWIPLGAESSTSYAAWKASLPTLDTWLEGRHARGHRVASMGLSYGSRGQARQDIAVGTLPGKSGRAFIAEMSKDHLSAFAEPSAALADRLSIEEVRELRNTGRLPDWYWTRLATEYDAVH